MTGAGVTTGAILNTKPPQGPVVVRLIGVMCCDENGGDAILSPFPPFFGSYRQVLSRTEGLTIYKYICLCTQPIPTSVIKPKIMALHEDRVGVVILGKWWETPIYLKGPALWAEVEKAMRKYHVQ